MESLISAPLKKIKDQLVKVVAGQWAWGWGPLTIVERGGLSEEVTHKINLSDEEWACDD